MPDTISVQVIRGDVVEARHRVHAIALDRGGDVLLTAGDPSRLAFLRSSAKPLQALPLARAFPALPDRLLAIACSSHLGSPEQLAAVRELLAVAGADEDALETGPDPTLIDHTCSGKHAGFLALCRAKDWPLTGYSAPEHPCQRLMLAEIAAAAAVAVDSIPTAVDGCGVPTYGLALDQAARMFGRLPFLEGGARVIAATRAHPELLRGPIAADVKLINERTGWMAKGGAEGLFCAVSSDGIALALKVDDGAFRAILPALAEVFRRLDLDPGELGEAPVTNSRGATVGRLVVE